MNDILRVSVVKLNTTDYLENDTVVTTLRDHVHWVDISRSTFNALGHIAPKGYSVLVDHYFQNEDMGSLSIDQALSRYDARVAEAAAVDAARNAKRPAKVKKVKKGLTAKQQRELDALRNELGENNG